MMPLTDTIFQRSWPARTCMMQGDQAWSYRELRERVASISDSLSRKTRPGERVGILSENGFDFTSAYLGCLHSGRVAVPVNTSTYRTDLDYVVKDCGIRILLVSQRFSGKTGLPESLIPEIEGRKELAPSAGKGLAALMYTSGSTGKPLAVQVTHKNLESNTSSILQYLDMNPEDRTMTVLPFHYCYGASLLHTTLASGGCLVINNRFMFPQKVVDELAEKRCTVIAGVPSTYKILMNQSRLGDSDTSSLRYALQAGGRLPPADLERLSSMLPETRIVVMYGQTEATARLSYLPPELFNAKLGSIGKGIPGVELRLMKRNGKEAAPGEVGEIAARGENISPGYWNNPEESSRTFREGWLYTGDMARKDEEGFIYLVGRSKDFVKVAGNRFSSVEVEDAISAMEGIENAAVIGVPDELLGESLHAFVVSQKDIKEEDVINTCRRELPSFKVPSRVTFVRELPLNSFGKVQKFRLSEMYGGV